MLKGKLFRYFGFTYKKRVKYESLWDLGTNDVLGVLTDWIPWQVWLGLWLCLGTLCLVLALKAPEDDEK